MNQLRRFFIPSSAIVENENIVLSGSEAKHLTTVLRLKKATQVEFFDETGTLYRATLKKAAADAVMAVIDTVHPPAKAANPFPLTLAQGMLKGKKMDLLVQKATELGVEQFSAVITRYCENKGNYARQVERWHRIMIETCKQCKRTTLMHITPVCILEHLNTKKFLHTYVAWEKEGNSVFPENIYKKKGAICLCIGPEGGWHADEINLLMNNGFLPFSLGSNILRGETAAISATAIIRFLTGNLGQKK